MSCSGCDDTEAAKIKAVMRGKDGGIKGNLSGREHLFVSSPELLNQRITICSQCPNQTDYGFCKECGCVIQLKARITLAKCPIGKW